MDRYETRRLAMEEGIVVQTVDRWTGEVADQRTEWYRMEDAHAAGQHDHNESTYADRCPVCRDAVEG